MTSEKNKLFAVLGLAFLLRVAGIGFGLPDLYHQDEPIIVNHALAIGVEGWNPHFFVIPPFIMYFLFLIYGALFVTGKIFGIFHGAADFALLFTRDPSVFYLLGRFFTGVFFGTATVWALWSGARRFFNEKTAWWAALFLAILPMHVQHSHYIYADIALTLAVTLMFFGLLSIAEDPSKKNYVWFGIWAGWGAATKYNALYFTPMLLIAHLAAHGKECFKRHNILKLILSGCICIATFLIIAPFTVFDWPHFWNQFSEQRAMNSQWNSFRFPWWIHLTYSIIGGTGWGFACLCVAGLYFLARTSRDKAAIAGGFVLIYYLLNLCGTQFFARYMLPLTPVLALLAAVSIENLWKSRRILCWVIMMVVCSELLLPTAYSDALFLRKDTRTQCLEWFERSVEPGATVVIDSRFFAPHLLPSPEQIKQKYDYLDDTEKNGAKKIRLDYMLKSLESKKTYNTYLLATDEQQKGSAFLFSKPFVNANWDDFKKIGAKYLVINHADETEKPGDSLTFDYNKHKLRSFIRSIPKRLELVQVFSPYKDDLKKWSVDRWDMTAAPHLPAEILSRKSLGPYLEVYRIKNE